jgi:DHA1 family bicyclomycin/chloramphenicol resistance-like MFS transporter
MLSMTMALVALAIDMILPAMGDLRETFGLSSDSNDVAAIITFFLLAVLLASRFLWGFGAAGSQVVARSVVRDTYQGEAMARAMSFIMAVFLLVPIAAPSLGALVLVLGTWEWIFLFMVLFAAGIALWTLRLPETLAKADRIPFHAGKLASAGKFVLSNKMTMGYTLAQATVFGLFASYLASSQLILDDIFGIGAWFPLFFGLLAMVMGAVMLINARLLKK